MSKSNTQRTSSQRTSSQRTSSNSTAQHRPGNLRAKRAKQRRLPGMILRYLILGLWAVGTIYPFVWVTLNSFKQKGKILSNSFSLPIGADFTWDNYRTAFDRVDIGTAYLNSFVISSTVTLLVILLGGLAAYGLARYNFRLKKFLQTLVVAAMMFPVFATIIPVFSMESAWGITNTDNRLLTWLSIILPQTAGNLTFAIVVLMGYIRGIPLDFEEAAYLEGSSVFGLYFKVIIPLAKPSFATVAIFVFLWSYNDLFSQMFFLRFRETFTITRLLNEISSQAGTNYGLMATAVVLAVGPVLLIYSLLQKNIIKGLTAGAIKG